MALKGIERVAERFCVQTAVYWGNPTNDGYGGYTFDTPVEIDCRWENKDMVQVGVKDVLLRNIGTILVTQDLDVDGYVYLGSLSDFDSDDDTSDPLSLDSIYRIFRFDKIPMVRKTDEFVRIAWLYDTKDM